MQHIQIVFENVHKDIEIDWESLGRLVNSVKQIFIAKEVDVQVRFLFATQYIADIQNETLAPIGPIKVSVHPVKDPVKRSDINPIFDSLVGGITSLINIFLVISCNAQTVTTPAQISVSTSFVTKKYVGGTEVSGF